MPEATERMCGSVKGPHASAEHAEFCRRRKSSQNFSAQIHKKWEK